MTERLSEQDLKELLTGIGERGADTVFGETRTVGDRVVIPVARLAYAGGGGLGGGRGRARVDAEGRGAEGVGVGFGLAAKPMGVFEVSADGARWVPLRSNRPAVLLAALAGVALFTSALRRR